MIICLINSFYYVTISSLHYDYFHAVGARYISISNYQASREDELSFVRGAIVKVINKYVDGWWLVR